MRSRNAWMVGLATAIVLALSSCWRPAFDLAISDSERLAKRLERVSGFTLGGYGESSSRAADFVPHRSLVPADGYLVETDGSSLYVRFIDCSSGSAIAYSSISFSNSLGEAALVSSLTAASASTISSAMGRGLLLAFSSDSSGVQARGLDASGQLSYSLAASMTGGATAPKLVGAYRSPLSAAINAFAIAQIETQGGTNELYLGNVTIDDTAALGALPVALSKPNIDGVWNVRPGAFVAFGTPYYYLSGILADGSLRTERWTGTTDSSPLVLTGVTRQLTDILSDGRLLARSGSSTIVYSAVGEELFEMLTGQLRFVHEVYDSGAGAWYSYFTRAVVIDANGDESSRKLKVDVYRIPTASLKDLS